MTLKTIMPFDFHSIFSGKHHIDFQAEMRKCQSVIKRDLGNRHRSNAVYGTATDLNKLLREWREESGGDTQTFPSGKLPAEYMTVISILFAILISPIVN